MSFRIIYCVFLIAIMGCAQKQKPGKHVFYLHGMIVEIQGIQAVSQEFGPYEYTQIIDSLKATGAEVHSEVRNEKTDFTEFSKKISAQIDALVSGGVSPGDITVIGASKGGMMAMNISDMNTHPVNYVLLGADSPYSESTFNWSLHGNILGIYEASDKSAPYDYSYWMEKSPDAIRFEQLQLHTGLGHGFLYRPIKEWLGPAREWMNAGH